MSAICIASAEASIRRSRHLKSYIAIESNTQELYAIHTMTASLNLETNPLWWEIYAQIPFGKDNAISFL